MTQQPQSQQQAPTTIYVSNRAFGKFPVQVTCPNCKASIETRVDSHTGIIQWLTAGGICLIGCWLGCCLIPLCVDDWRDVDHFCPNCNALVGRYKFGL